MKRILILTALLLPFLMQAQQNRSSDERDLRPESTFHTSVPSHLFDLLLARPTAHSITLSILFYENRDIRIAYGLGSTGEEKTGPIACKAGKPQEVVLIGLKADACYRFELLDASGKTIGSQPMRFHTQRAVESDFTFTLTSDSHLDENADVEVYRKTLLNAARDSADFHFDLGDTFMTDKYRVDYTKAFDQYLAQRYYFGLLCTSSPLFFVPGNHDGEAGQRLNGSENNMTVWSNRQRKTYFPNPLPDAFYGGNTDSTAFVGSPQDYFSFEWGNALFVTLDPFWYTPRSGNDQPWDRTLGKRQYEWLKSTLSRSKSRFKFVFIHNLVGGADNKGKARGGVEVADKYEWGGMNADGTDDFSAHRPGWDSPIHDLLRKYHVTAVFHGHDHLFAQQVKDGILYQCLPQPGAFKTGNLNFAKEYGYVNGLLRNDAGYLRVQVKQRQAIVEYVGTATGSVLNQNILTAP